MADHDSERPSGLGRADRGLKLTELPGAEAYLEAIYVLRTEAGRARAARVAEYLGVSPVSVSKSLRRLEAAGVVVRRAPFIDLSPKGWDEAAQVVRRHRLVERWLADRLGLGLIEAHREAERLEHAFSPMVTEALWEEMGCPATCPHGNPIPGPGGELPVVPKAIPLKDADAEMVRIDRLFEQLEGLEDLLGWAEAHGLVPGREVSVRRSAAGIQVPDGTAGWADVPEAVAARVLVLAP